ncbi:MAG TPA: hypothetical protein PKY91_10270, partial [Rhodocyclaceae bacterium]|nr:hypothetical protein [Rhodocyclaceae bacterium]
MGQLALSLCRGIDRDTSLRFVRSASTATASAASSATTAGFVAGRHFLGGSGSGKRPRIQLIAC